MAFGGSLYGSYLSVLERLAVALDAVGGRLHIFGPPHPDRARMARLQRPNIQLHGMVGAAELMSRCRETADVMFVPMSFEPRERRNMEIAFPSKLADCTAIGLPLLINGPDYCSAVRWARDNPGVAEIVTDDSVESLRAALQRLAEPAHRWRLAEQAIQRGREYFSHARAEASLFGALQKK